MGFDRSVTCIVGIMVVSAVCFVGESSAAGVEEMKVNVTSVPRKLLALPGASEYDGWGGSEEGAGGSADGAGGSDDGFGGSINRIGTGCSKRSIDVFQGPTAPLPSGIPTYTVEVQNVCVTGNCSIANIHLNCGWFSSARLINPNIFRRLSFNDCLLNNGQPIAPGQTLTFQYANTFPYPLSVSSLACL